jgi:hypothetical protein
MTEEQLKLAKKLLKQSKSIRYVADVFLGGGAFYHPLPISPSLNLLAILCSRPVNRRIYRAKKCSVYRAK